jgi:hypothetical protein
MYKRLSTLALVVLALTPIFAAPQPPAEAPALTIWDENARSGNGWNTAVQTYRFYTDASGLISRVEFHMQGGELPDQSVVVNRSGDKVDWSWNQPNYGKTHYKLERSGQQWAGTAEFVSEVTVGDNDVTPLVVAWNEGSSRLWTDNERSALLLPDHHYLEERVNPDTDATWTTVYELQGDTMLEHYRELINAKLEFTRSNDLVKVERYEQPYDLNWSKEGWTDLRGRSLVVADPGINALNWKILYSVVQCPTFIPFLLDVGL